MDAVRMIKAIGEEFMLVHSEALQDDLTRRQNVKAELLANPTGRLRTHNPQQQLLGIKTSEAEYVIKHPNPMMVKVCQVPDCGCTGEAHP